MADLLIVYRYPSPELRQKSLPVDTFGTEDLHALINRMILVASQNGGAGLAAPQIGVLTRIFVRNTTDGWIGICNPEIISVGAGKASGVEGCLSLPGIRASVVRATRVEMKYFDPEGNTIIKELDGFDARLVQHEIDHLDGILFIDHLSPYVRRAAMRRYHG